MSSPTGSNKLELSPASIDAGSEPQTPSDCVSSTGVAQPSLNDEQSVQVVTGESGSYAINTASPTKGYSPSTERYTPPFARGNKSDDVFKTESPSRHSTGSSHHSAFSTTPSGGKKSQKGIESTNWRAPSSSGDNTESVGFSPSPRSGTARRLSFGTNSINTPMSSVRADDAQGVYPPSCCVFVANLLQTEGEETLQMAVTQVFREFGPVFVKIRRDAKQMPFAFCQYTSSEHADRAVAEGRGRLIRGRPCRCEKAKAHRLFFVERKYGAAVTAEEVRELLQPYGRIEFCYPASYLERTALGLNDGVIIQFRLYDDGQNAQSAFRNHELWKLIAIAGINSPNRGTANYQGRNSSTASDNARAYLSRYETDRRSIFVGNLPLGITEDQIKCYFESYGRVEEITVHHSSSKFEPQERLVFAFVQFQTVMAVSNVLAVKTGFNFDGKTLRISQKDSENGGPKRSSRTYSSAPTAPPAPAAPDTNQSPTPTYGPAQQPISPMPMAPPAYGSSPYAYPYGSPYYYPPGSFYSDGQHYFHPPTYPGYYSYPGSPAYDTTASSTVPVAGSPATAQSYYGYAYPGYQYSTQAYWGMTGPASPAAAQPSASPVPHSPVYSTYPPIASSTNVDDRSTTPTPADHGASAEDSLES